jgi:ribosomal protein L14E/L6E/L27E
LKKLPQPKQRTSQQCTLCALNDPIINLIAFYRPSDNRLIKYIEDKYSVVVGGNEIIEHKTKHLYIPKEESTESKVKSPEQLLAETIAQLREEIRELEAAGLTNTRQYMDKKELLLKYLKLQAESDTPVDEEKSITFLLRKLLRGEQHEEH